MYDGATVLQPLFMRNPCVVIGYEHNVLMPVLNHILPPSAVHHDSITSLRQRVSHDTWQIATLVAVITHHREAEQLLKLVSQAQRIVAVIDVAADAAIVSRLISASGRLIICVPPWPKSRAHVITKVQPLLPASTDEQHHIARRLLGCGPAARLVAFSLDWSSAIQVF